jgi:hypothetical protein
MLSAEGEIVGVGLQENPNEDIGSIVLVIE